MEKLNNSEAWVFAGATEAQRATGTKGRHVGPMLLAWCFRLQTVLQAAPKAQQKASPKMKPVASPNRSLARDGSWQVICLTCPVMSGSFCDWPGRFRVSEHVFVSGANSVGWLTNTRPRNEILAWHSRATSKCKPPLAWLLFAEEQALTCHMPQCFRDYSVTCAAALLCLTFIHANLVLLVCLLLLCPFAPLLHG